MKKKICVAIIFALFIVFVEMFIDSSSEGSKIMTAELSKYRKGVNVLRIKNIVCPKIILLRKAVKREMLFIK